jgi:hypothetical protein
MNTHTNYSTLQIRDKEFKFRQCNKLSGAYSELQRTVSGLKETFVKRQADLSSKTSKLEVVLSEANRMWTAAEDVQTRADRTADMVMHYS